jgi:hypothetical protein
MAEQTSWWGRMLATVSREYERRIRAASLLTEYGVAHGSAHSNEDDEGEAAEIVNLPRGSRLRPAFQAEPNTLGHEESPAP